MLIFKLRWSGTVLWLRLPLRDVEDVSAPLFPPAYRLAFPSFFLPLRCLLGTSSEWMAIDRHPPSAIELHSQWVVPLPSPISPFTQKTVMGLTAYNLPNACEYQCSFSSAPWLKTFPADEASISTIPKVYQDLCDCGSLVVTPHHLNMARGQHLLVGPALKTMTSSLDTGA